MIAAMLGLGAGIDYSLLIMGRYREQRQLAGDSLQDAAARRVQPPAPRSWPRA